MLLTDPADFAGRQGVRRQRQPRLPAPARDPGDDPIKADHAANRRKLGSNGGRPPTFDPERYKQRHAVGCGINQLKRNRGIGHPIRQLAVRYQATVIIAAIDEWLPAD